jgi:uncharacterized protein (DUF433 family)
VKNYPLLDQNPAWCSGRPHIAGTRITTAHIWQICAGSDSEDHLKALQEMWPYITAEQFRAAISFERGKCGQADALPARPSR